jgi:hypothetical protein
MQACFGRHFIVPCRSRDMMKFLNRASVHSPPHLVLGGLGIKQGF